MPSNDQPVIRVLGFKTTYERLPVRGTDPLNQKLDAKGYVLDAVGKRLLEVQEEHWVTYCPAHSPINSKNVERVRHMIPDPTRMGNDPEGAKLAFAMARWSQIEPAYEAWKNGQGVPVTGTPLGAYPALNEEQVNVLRGLGIRTVEELRDLSEVQIDRVPLPHMREVRKQAGMFLDNLDGAAAAEREAAKDREMETMRERMAEMEALLEERTAPAGDDDELATLRAQLDAKGIEYDGRWRAPKLRALLAEQENEAA